MPGSSTNAWLVSSTSPVSGEYKSLAACRENHSDSQTLPALLLKSVYRAPTVGMTLTDSSTPNVVSFSTSEPTSGSSTNTTSPNSLCGAQIVDLLCTSCSPTEHRQEKSGQITEGGVWVQIWETLPERSQTTPQLQCRRRPSPTRETWHISDLHELRTAVVSELLVR